MVFRLRKSGGDREYNSQRVIPARFASKCNCGRQIKAGEQISWDPALRRASCLVCAKRVAELSDSGLTEVKVAPESIKIIDRIRQMRLLPQSPEISQETDTLIARLIIDYASEKDAQTWLSSEYEIPTHIKLFASNGNKSCRYCDLVPATGKLIAWWTIDKLIACWPCFCARRA